MKGMVVLIKQWMVSEPGWLLRCNAKSADQRDERNNIVNFMFIRSKMIDDKSQCLLHELVRLVYLVA